MIVLSLFLLAAPTATPDVTNDDARSVLRAAIDRGAPLYNQGSPKACAAVYEIAALSLVQLGGGALSEDDRGLLEATLASLPRGDSDRAWALRRSFDAVLGAGPRPALPGPAKRVSGPDAPVAADGPAVPLKGPWREVDDRVMGGISRGAASVDRSGRLVWTGRMTTESNGGFVTARTAFDGIDLSQAGGLVFRVRGDGRIYKATLNTNGSHMLGIGLARLATVRGEWVDIRVPFGAFSGPMFRGTRAFDPSNVFSLQFQLSGADQVGDYRLEVASVTAYQAR